LFDLGLADTAYPYLLFLSQAETERILIEHCGIAVERRVELTALEAGPDGVTCQLAHGDGRQETVTAHYVVGCDGAHSTVRRLAGIPFEGAAYPQTFVLADVEAEGVEAGSAHAFASAKGILFFFPLLRPASWRLLAMRAPTDPTPPDAPVTLDDVQALADAYTGGAVRLHDPVWMTNFRSHHRAAGRYRDGRVFLAGDAAHIHSPAGAQGMNTGIQDAVNLGWKLACALHGATDPALLDSYAAERAPIGRMVLRITDRAFRIATSTNPVVGFARTRLAPLLIPLVLKPKTFRGFAFRTVSQLAIRYRRSPLSVEGPNPPRRGPRSGDRFPDASMVAAPGWHLVLYGPPDAWPDVVLGDRCHVHRLAAPSAACYLVRPDGHVGYRAGGTDLSGVLRYLDRWCSAG
jgi:2-polyprenyl-6-methoxyphenol hydroxylase-like FAD-dependent oxidoreductase